MAVAAISARSKYKLEWLECFVNLARDARARLKQYARVVKNTGDTHNNAALAVALAIPDPADGGFRKQV